MILPTSTVQMYVIARAWGIDIYTSLKEHDHQVRVILTPHRRREVKVVLFIRRGPDLPTCHAEPEEDFAGVDGLERRKVAYAGRCRR